MLHNSFFHISKTSFYWLQSLNLQDADVAYMCIAQFMPPEVSHTDN